MELTARVTVTRPRYVSKNFFGRLYLITMSLDGERLASLLAGESVTREIEAGHHRLRAFNTFIWKTVKFDVEPGEHVRFVTANRAGFGTMGLASMFGIGPLYVTLERERDNPTEGGCGSRSMSQS